MSAGWVQSGRFLSLETPLGPDKLLLRSFTGREGISQLFQFNLDLLSEDGIPFDQIIGQRVTFGVKLFDETKEHYFNGFVSRFSRLPSELRLNHYQAEVVPWLWFLTRTADCRIFQDMSVPDIVEKVFGDLGFEDYEFRLEGSYKPWEYCVQYRETAFNFVTRLLEQEGIYYFFRHQRGKHTLVAADSPSAHGSCPEQSQAAFERAGGVGVKRHEDVVFTWKLDQQFSTGTYAMTDYNFEVPATSLMSEVDSQIDQGGNRRYEIYDYPGEFEHRDEGEQWVKRRIEEVEASHAIASGESNCRAFASGCKFELTEYECADQNGPYVLTSVAHQAQEGGFYSGEGSLTTPSYQNSFTAIPYPVAFRPPRLTRKPLIQGTQTAIVVGPAGEEIYTDKYGRVKVQFHWDRRGQRDEKSSCWIRVSQPWAGKGWGAIWVPRIGQEVIVDFLEGDPDRPIITGRVYNALQTPPYPLPDEHTKSTFKSYSSKGGEGFNEIRFEDRKGQEQIFIHAERNQDIRVKGSVFETIGGERHLLLGQDRLELVKGDQHLHVRGDQNEKVEGTASFQAGMDLQEKVGMNYALEAGTAIHLKAGMNLVFESGTSLTLKVGSNFININPSGVYVSGAMVMINSGGVAGCGAGSYPHPPKVPQEADTAKPGEKAALPPPPPLKPVSYGPAAVVLKQAAQSGAALCDI